MVMCCEIETSWFVSSRYTKGFSSSVKLKHQTTINKNNIGAAMDTPKTNMITAATV
jgi:hypothetical protein